MSRTGRNVLKRVKFLNVAQLNAKAKLQNQHIGTRLNTLNILKFNIRRESFFRRKKITLYSTDDTNMV